MVGVDPMVNTHHQAGDYRRSLSAEMAEVELLFWRVHCTRKLAGAAGEVPSMMVASACCSAAFLPEVGWLVVRGNMSGMVHWTVA